MRIENDGKLTTNKVEQHLLKASMIDYAQESQEARNDEVLELYFISRPL